VFASEGCLERKRFQVIASDREPTTFFKLAYH
jgi:hypothetical protein